MPIAPELLLPFLAASVLITVIPGADMALVTRQVLVGGQGLARRTIAGNLTGILVHGVALAAGLSALIVASATAYTTVKLAGAVYLVWLGVQAIRSARRPAAEVDVSGAAPKRAFLAGLISTVLNPKPALFFLTFLPQFVDPGRGAVLPQTLTLAAIHVVVGLVWLTAYAYLVDRARAALTAPR
ncbi:MAG TPA: LysE family translocator, partial [Thermoleophilaceae bacterium]